MSAVEWDAGPGAQTQADGEDRAEAGADVGAGTAAAPGPETETGGVLGLEDAAGLAPIGHGADPQVAVLDWFGAGHPDLLISAAGGPLGRTVRVYRHHPAGGELPAHYDEGTPEPALDGLAHPCPIPNGAVSRFDLVALAPEGLVLLRNSGEAGRPEFGPREPLGLPADLGTGSGRVAQMVAEDWDGDGRVDLLIGLDDLAGYWPDGNAVPAAQQVGFNQRGGHPGYDRNGAWRGQAAKGRIVWLKNTGEPAAPRFELQEDIGDDLGRLDLATRPAPLVVSWGGRGGWELLLADARGEVRLFRNFGGQRPPVLMEPRPLRVAGQPLTLPDDRTTVIAADLDGDRRPELLYGAADGRLFAIHAGPGRDEAHPAAPVLGARRSLWLGGHAVVAAGDLHGSGGVDLVAGDTSGRLWLARDRGGPGDRRFARPIELDSAGAPFRVDPGPDGRLEGPAAPPLGYACPALADWSGHGRLDVVLGGAGGEVIVLRNNGTATDPRFDVPRGLKLGAGPLITPPRVRPALADWHGTGQLDLIALDLQGFLCAYPRAEKYEVGQPVPLTDRLGRVLRLDGGFGQSGRCALWAGSWTGSGRPDVLVGLPRGARHVIPALTGTPLSDPDDLPTVLLLENAGRGVLVPRPLRLADGRPVVVGAEGCSPCGVAWGEDGALDLLVGADDGFVHHFRRADLRW